MLILFFLRNVQESHGNTLTAVAGGISEALITAVLGLFVAIPAVMMFSYFTSNIKAFNVVPVLLPLVPCFTV